MRQAKSNTPIPNGKQNNNSEQNMWPNENQLEVIAQNLFTTLNIFFCLFSQNLFRFFSTPIIFFYFLGILRSCILKSHTLTAEQINEYWMQSNIRKIT